MKQPKTLTPEKFALTAGSILMAPPSLYWLGVALAVFFEKPLIVQEIMLPVDRISSIFTIMIMIGLPVMTLFINIKAMMHMQYSADNDNVLVDVEVRNNVWQWILIAYAAATIIITFSYYFFEKFVFFSDQNLY